VYDVTEFFRPERFTPGVSGRVDPIVTPQLQLVAITNWGDFDYSRQATEIVKAQQNI
jgi:hypothetical protein